MTTGSVPLQPPHGIPESQAVDATPAKRPRFTDAEGAKRWLKTLPSTSLVSVYDAIVGQLTALSAAEIPPLERARIAEVLRHQVAHLHGVLARRYAARPQPPQESEHEAAKQAIRMWQALWAQYSACLTPLAEGNSDLAEAKSKLLQRGLYVGKQLVLVYGLARQAPPPALWDQLHWYYLNAEVLGCAATAVSDPLIPHGVGTSCYSTYSHALLLSLADPCALHVREIELVDRWLEMWSRKVFPGATQRDNEGALFMVDLGSSEGAMLLSSPPIEVKESMRFAYNGKLATSVRGRLKLLRTGAEPVDLQLGHDCSSEQCTTLLAHLDWCWCRPAREAVAGAELQVPAQLCGGGVMGAFYRAGGRDLDRHDPLRPMGFRATEHLASIDTLSEYDRDKERIEREWPWEQWQGSCKTQEARFVRTGALRYRWNLDHLVFVDEGGHRRLGFVTRTARGGDNRFDITLRLYPGLPKSIAMRSVSIAVSEEHPNVPALVLSGTIDDNPFLILPPRTFSPNRMLKSGEGAGERVFRLLRLVQRGADFERVAFEETR